MTSVGRRFPASVALVVGGLLLTTHPVQALTLVLTITPTTISFPDANPTTTPVIPANTSVNLQLVVDKAKPTDLWSVGALAGGDLMSGPSSIAISNVSWTSVKTVWECPEWCTCLAGTASRVMPQLVLNGQGISKGVTCMQSYSLANSWSYNAGSYSQIVTITATSP